jgi:hypothetical protein
VTGNLTHERIVPKEPWYALQAGLDERRRRHLPLVAWSQRALHPVTDDSCDSSYRRREEWLARWPLDGNWDYGRRPLSRSSHARPPGCGASSVTLTTPVGEWLRTVENADE